VHSRAKTGAPGTIPVEVSGDSPPPKPVYPAGGRLWRMAPRTVDAAIAVGHEPGVEVQEEALSSVPDAVVAPPFSVSIYSFAVGSSGAGPGAGD